MDGRKTFSSCGHHSKPTNHEPQPSHINTQGDHLDLENVFEDSATTFENLERNPEHIYVVPHLEVNALFHLTQAYALEIGQFHISPFFPIRQPNYRSHIEIEHKILVDFVELSLQEISKPLEQIPPSPPSSSHTTNSPTPMLELNMQSYKILH